LIDQGAAEDIKQHRWFDGFDWEALVQRRLPAPFVPEVSHCTFSHFLVPSDSVRHSEAVHQSTAAARTRENLVHHCCSGKVAGRPDDLAAFVLRRLVSCWGMSQVRGPTDTHNFDNYPDSVEEAKEPTFTDGVDPFANF
jgi:hypothetical protein